LRLILVFKGFISYIILSYGQKYKGGVVPHVEYDASHGLFLILIF